MPAAGGATINIPACCRAIIVNVSIFTATAKEAREKKR
jgi:hypothetical protein